MLSNMNLQLVDNEVHQLILCIFRILFSNKFIQRIFWDLEHFPSYFWSLYVRYIPIQDGCQLLYHCVTNSLLIGVQYIPYRWWTWVMSFQDGCQLLYQHSARFLAFELEPATRILPKCASIVSLYIYKTSYCGVGVTSTATSQHFHW